MPLPSLQARSYRARLGAQRRTDQEAAVTKALKEFIARREQQRIVELFRNLDWEPGYDYKSDRSRR
jgi:hypothetical protein